MKKKKLIIIGSLIFLVVVCTIFFSSTGSEENKIVETTLNTATVSNQTIETTLTAPGEVQSGTMEKLTLNTSYYYLNMCVEEEEFVKKGENLLKYTNGTYLVAPYDCVVMSYSVPTAKEICTSSNYVYVASLEDLYMDINISEEQINKISIGQEVEITANYDETKTYKGTITKINAIGTHSSGGTTFAAIASIENDDTLKLGMSATCTVTIEKNENLLCIPIEAVLIENNERFVNKVQEDGSIEKVQIETEKSNANYVEIKSGLSLDDTVQYETTTVTTILEDEESSSKNIFSSIIGENNKSSERENRRGNF